MKEFNTRLESRHREEVHHNVIQTIQTSFKTLNAGQYLVTVGDASYKVGGRLVPSPDTNSTELVSCVKRPDVIDITLCVRFVTLMEQSQDRG